MSLEQNGVTENGQQTEDNIISLSGMYQEYFLDYASYVILERAVPAIEDGLKPVQRRILHSMKSMDDGRYHKVANIIGHTMQYHPHGDAAIGAALVNMGQKNLLIDCQGNWGDVRTGDSAAAARYIEARLTKFGLEVLFNKKTTEWQVSYDGRKNEPITLPVKFPLLLAHGVEGIAVGLSTKILPHNFIELLKASIQLLKGRTTKIYPDFQTGGKIDVSNYNDGKRGGKVRVRAKIEQRDKKTLAITELPYAVTTVNLMDSIVKANEKGKIKIKKVVDNTAKDVEILVELVPGTSPTVTIDALYAFTNCEVSISPNACVIIDDKPHFLTVQDILKVCVENTKTLLKWELDIEMKELEEKWHFASLEKIFIEKRIYRKIEQCESWEEVLEVIAKGLKPHVKHFKRAVTTDDITKLTEIKIRKISKYNTFKADELIKGLEEQMEEVKHHLEHLVAYTIAFFQNLLDKYGKGKERKTIITSFDTIQATQVVANNCKLYVNRKEGFIGHGLKKDEFVADCSDIDDIIIFRKDGKYLVTRISDKAFVGKNIEHVAIWKKGDERTTYNAAYYDGNSGRSFVKRFNVKAITRDRAYNICTDHKRSKLLYFSANQNGEAEVVRVLLTQNCTAKIKTFEYDYQTLAIKGRTTKGNLLSKYPVRSVKLLRAGKSTLSAQKVWMDSVSGRLNTEERGKYIGAFDTDDKILAVYQSGEYEVNDLEMTARYDVAKLADIIKLTPTTVVTALYYDGERQATFLKRFKIETSTTDNKFSFITDHKSSKLLFATIKKSPKVAYSIKVRSKTTKGEFDLDALIDVKGWKSIGNRVSEHKLRTVKLLDFEEEKEELEASEKEITKETATTKKGTGTLF